MSPAFLSLSGMGIPLFRAERDGESLYYTPGHLAGVPRASAPGLERRLRRWAAGQAPADGPGGLPQSRAGPGPAAPLVEDHPGAADAAIPQIARALIASATEVDRAWADRWDRPFSPLCLTIYPHGSCNLACPYCFGDAGPEKSATPLSLRAVRSAARVVAENCRAAGRPFALVLHGGGEPTLHRPWVDRALDAVEGMLPEYGLPIFRYAATHGYLSEQKAAWLAGRFDLVGLSCDGPEDIQSAQRPHCTGRPTTPWVERTARVVRAGGRPLHVRATIAPATFGRQAEIAAYLCERLRPAEIHAEPLYRGGRAGPAIAFRAEQAQEYVAHFLEARRVAQSYGVRWLASGSRPGELHGPYCHILRSVLLLVPGGAVSTCFKSCDAVQARREGTQIGTCGPGRAGLRLDGERVSRLLQTLAGHLETCLGCFNYYHCARSCPDACLLADDRPAGTFRCLVQRSISEAVLDETARQARSGGDFWIRRVSSDPWMP